jgi:hypothetical protein
MNTSSLASACSRRGHWPLNTPVMHTAPLPRRQYRSFAVAASHHGSIWFVLWARERRMWDWFGVARRERPAPHSIATLAANRVVVGSAAATSPAAHVGHRNALK